MRCAAQAAQRCVDSPLPPIASSMPMPPALPHVVLCRSCCNTLGARALATHHVASVVHCYDTCIFHAPVLLAACSIIFKDNDFEVSAAAAAAASLTQHLVCLCCLHFSRCCKVCDQKSFTATDCRVCVLASVLNDGAAGVFAAALPNL
jgi:hypothetical protein